MVRLTWQRPRGVGVHFNKFIEHAKQKPRGQAMVEFSLILVVMLGMFIGTFELMVLFRKRTDLATATRMAARQASEEWIETADEADFVADINDYVLQEMGKMGYNTDWMTNGTPADDSDDRLRISIDALTLDPVSNTFVSPTPASSVCTYGQYIEVTLDMDWEFVVLPLNALLDSGAPERGALSETSMVRCWRGN